MSAHEFDQAVEDALASIPAEFQRVLRHVAVIVEPECAPGEEELLGVYEGIPLTERDEWSAGALPDRIVVFQGPLERMCHTREELLEQIAVTVVHEVAHHFGIDDDRLHELGWG